MSDLVPARLLARLERLQLRTRQRLAGGLSGEHRSPRHGSSLDFADFRDYHPGDDLRRLDLNALARLDKLLIRLYDAEDDLTLRLLVDTSGSMAGPKLQRACQLAGALGFSALIRRDIVSVHTFPVRTPGPRYRGRTATAALFAHLEKLEASGESPLETAASEVLTQPGPAGLTIVLSDMLTPDWEASLDRLPARRGDFVVVHVLEPDELDPQMSGDLELIDSETGARLEVSLSSAALKDYRSMATAWADEVGDRVRARGGAYLRVLTSDDLESLVLGPARTSGILR